MPGERRQRSHGPGIAGNGHCGIELDIGIAALKTKGLRVLQNFFKKIDVPIDRPEYLCYSGFVIERHERNKAHGRKMMRVAGRTELVDIKSLRH